MVEPDRLIIRLILSADVSLSHIDQYRLYIGRYENLIFKNIMQKNMLGVVCPAECALTGDKTAGIRKCNNYLT